MVMSARRVKFDLKCKYDAFVSYDCQSDRDSVWNPLSTLWIMEHLIPQIEAKDRDDATTESDALLQVNMHMYRLAAFLINSYVCQTAMAFAGTYLITWLKY